MRARWMMACGSSDALMSPSNVMSTAPTVVCTPGVTSTTTAGTPPHTTTGSGSSRIPKRSYTLVWMARASVTTSPPVAPPRFTSTSACFS
jgi:hypothetical protein